MPYDVKTSADLRKAVEELKRSAEQAQRENSLGTRLYQYGAGRAAALSDVLLLLEGLEHAEKEKNAAVGLPAHPDGAFRYRVSVHFNPVPGNTFQGRTVQTIWASGDEAERQYTEYTHEPSGPTVELWEERLLRSN